MQLVVGQSGTWVFWDKFRFAYHWIGCGNENFWVVWWHDAKLDDGMEKWSWEDEKDGTTPWFRIYEVSDNESESESSEWEVVDPRVKRRKRFVTAAPAA